MARRQLTYTELRVALLAVAAVAVLTVGIFYFTDHSVWEPKYELKMYLPEAEQLVAGAPVSLGGVTVGSVTRLRINPDAKTPDQNIEVDMNIFKQYRNWIRTNSTGAVATQGALGGGYVTITRGTPPSPVIPPGGVVTGVPAVSLLTLMGPSSGLVENLDAIRKNIRDISNQIQSGKGTLGALLYDQQLRNRLNDLMSRTDDIKAKIQNGQGSIGKFLASDQLRNHANSAVRRADAVFDDLKGQKGSLGKLIYDPAFRNNAKDFLKRGNTLLANVEAGHGSLGKFLTDRSLDDNFRATSANLQDLTRKMNRREATTGEISANPDLYNDLNRLSGDLRVLMTDFRKHPKKYLRIRMSIF
jgi:phospholipid/cholesterol/gamma-HCH transport system substrate-binding protein